MHMKYMKYEHMCTKPPGSSCFDMQYTVRVVYPLYHLYTDFTFGFENREQAERWHDLLSECLVDIKRLTAGSATAAGSGNGGAGYPGSSNSGHAGGLVSSSPPVGGVGGGSLLKRLASTGSLTELIMGGGGGKATVTRRDSNASLSSSMTGEQHKVGTVPFMLKLLGSCLHM
jgi:hypothetical protein